MNTSLGDETMKAQLKCSKCGAEISNLTISYWEKKQWLWFIPFLIFIVSMPLLFQYLTKDKNDFRSDLRLSNTEKNYDNGTIEVFGVIENGGKVDWESIVIEAEFFADNGIFLDELTERICTNLLPGASEHFKISSKDFPQSRWDAIHEMKVKVADAYHAKF
jgi:hypothetical protein